MKQFFKSTSALKPRTRDSEQVAYLYAFILTVLVLCQLFTFDKFLVLLEGYNLTGGQLMAHIVGSLIVVSEVFALPFLLGLKLSLLMRVISMVCGWLVPLLWFILSLWLVTVAPYVQNVGFLGTVTDLIPGWWTVYISFALGVLAAWTSWGLWPGKRN
jgi:hypothetical protein